MIGAAMQPRRRARYLAPIALAAVLAGTYLVVSSAQSTKSSVHHHHVGGSGGHRSSAGSRFYVVRPADNLTGIANRTGIPVGALEALNPRVDPNSLQTGQRLRLRR